MPMQAIKNNHRVMALSKMSSITQLLMVHKIHITTTSEWNKNRLPCTHAIDCQNFIHMALWYMLVVVIASWLHPLGAAKITNHQKARIATSQ
eukprot:8513827-Ditylum_brightwellii.AAC.1